MTKSLSLIVGLVLCLAGQSFGLCEPGWIETEDGQCYKFEQSVSLSWNETIGYCKELGAKTLEIKSADLLAKVMGYIKFYELTGDFWLAGSDEAGEGDWLWQDSTRVEKGTPFWALHNGIRGWSLEPEGGEDENCLAMVSDRFYFFDDRDCLNVYHPICSTTSTTKGKKTSAVRRKAEKKVVKEEIVPKW